MDGETVTRFDDDRTRHRRRLLCGGGACPPAASRQLLAKTGPGSKADPEAAPDICETKLIK